MVCCVPAHGVEGERAPRHAYPMQLSIVFASPMDTCTIVSSIELQYNLVQAAAPGHRGVPPPTSRTLGNRAADVSLPFDPRRDAGSRGRPGRKQAPPPYFTAFVLCMALPVKRFHFLFFKPPSRANSCVTLLRPSAWQLRTAGHRGVPHAQSRLSNYRSASAGNRSRTEWVCYFFPNSLAARCRAPRALARLLPVYACVCPDAFGCAACAFAGAFAFGPPMLSLTSRAPSLPLSLPPFLTPRPVPRP